MIVQVADQGRGVQARGWDEGNRIWNCWLHNPILNSFLGTGYLIIDLLDEPVHVVSLLGLFQNYYHEVNKILSCFFQVVLKATEFFNLFLK